jgi:hypothetical protein
MLIVAPVTLAVDGLVHHTKAIFKELLTDGVPFVCIS